ncbi:MAG: 2-amino-4-hydroxy-6-hydroxymethyldihydropteridine diphosphokinase [Anaerolineales bacterium]|nr:2-amino-4-hydroxy-6-hydroxymethyldihydropteridine diphosphokinase [Anaerolineales bacterium]
MTGQTAPQDEVCLLLGSNIQPERYLPQAVALLGEQLSILGVSSAWQTPAVGADGPDFLNAAVLARTSLDLVSLKTDVLRPLEARLGRVRSANKYAARSIDIDPVAWNGQPLDDDLWRHAHAAAPVAELLPSLWSNERRETLAQVAQSLSRETPIRPRPDVILA